MWLVGFVWALLGFNSHGQHQKDALFKIRVLWRFRAPVEVRRSGILSGMGMGIPDSIPDSYVEICVHRVPYPNPYPIEILDRVWTNRVYPSGIPEIFQIPDTRYPLGYVTLVTIHMRFPRDSSNISHGYRSFLSLGCITRVCDANAINGG